MKFFLHVCTHECGSDASTQKSIAVFGKEYPMNYRGTVEVDYQINGDSLLFEIPEFNHKPSLGDAAHINAVVIRLCDSKISVQALYDDLERTAMASCCNAGGCSCYASGGCSC